jgi:hypothetical protein
MLEPSSRGGGIIDFRLRQWLLGIMVSGILISKWQSAQWIDADDCLVGRIRI